METALIAILGVALAGLLGIVQFELNGIRQDIRDLRHDVNELRVEVGRIGQKLDDHITDHPAGART